MKNKIGNILLVIAFGIIIWMSWNPRVVTKVETRTVTLPAKQGTTKFVEVEKFVRDTVYLPSKEKVVVDQKYKRLYEEAKDSLERQSLYLEAIRIREYEQVFLDNDTITIGGKITTRGSLVGYKLDYFIKESQLTYTPEVEFRMPEMSIGIGIEAGIPTNRDDRFTLKGNLFLNRGSNGYMISYDTDGMFWLGYNKTFKLY